MIRRAGGSFKQGTNPASYGFSNVSVGDLTGAEASTTLASWTTGATQIINSGIVPIAFEHSRILAVSFSAGLYASYNGGTGAAGRMWGKLGKIVAGLVQQSPSVSNALFPWQWPVQPLPADASLITELWNPNNDPMPPIQRLSAPQADVSPLQLDGSIALPEPLEIAGNGEVNVGIWIEPSLVLNILLAVVSAQYMIIYDDGT